MEPRAVSSSSRLEWPLATMSEAAHRSIFVRGCKSSWEPVQSTKTSYGHHFQLTGRLWWQLVAATTRPPETVTNDSAIRLVCLEQLLYMAGQLYDNLHRFQQPGAVLNTLALFWVVSLEKSPWNGMYKRVFKNSPILRVRRRKQQKHPQQDTSQGATP